MLTVTLKGDCVHTKPSKCAIPPPPFVTHTSLSAVASIVTTVVSGS